MTVTVHIGMPRAAAISLQRHYFARCETITYLGKLSGDAELDARVNELCLTPEARFDLAGCKTFFDARLAAASPGLISDDQLTSWRTRPLEDTGRRVAEVFPAHRLLYIVQKPTVWAPQYYMNRVTRFTRDAFTGLNPWLEKHMSQFVDGTEVGQALFARTLDRFVDGSGAKDILVLPVEAFHADRDGFVAQIDGFLGAGGEMSAIKPKRKVLEPPAAGRLEANFARVLSLLRRETQTFLAMTEKLSVYGSDEARAVYGQLVDAGERSLDAWIAWFRSIHAPILQALNEGDPNLAATLDLFDDYEVREGLMAHLLEIEQEETEALLERYGVDLRPYGYAAPPVGAT
ncbi:MAG: hypothetical protein ACXW3D_10515 [Caulobacteraceae bacterium]